MSRTRRPVGGAGEYFLFSKWSWAPIIGSSNGFMTDSCRAYSTVAVMETMHALATSDLRSLSVQEVIDCSYGYLMALFGCKGGNTCSALQWMKTVSGCLSRWMKLPKNFECWPISGSVVSKTKIGIVEDKSYPTVNKDEQCLITKNSSYDGVKVRDFTCVRWVGLLVFHLFHFCFVISWFPCHLLVM